MSTHPQNNISKAQLMQHYQTDVFDHKTRKAQEKQDRITQERQEMNRLQKELDDEKKFKQQSKTDLMNSQKAEYESFMTRKKQQMRELSVNPHRKKDSEPQGTYKISGENREIRRKNYDEALDSLNLNPTRRENNLSAIYNSDYAQQRTLQMQAAAMNRGRSQGYNILNHEAQEKNSKISHYEGGYGNGNATNIHPQRNQPLMQAYNQAPNIEGLENLENYELEKYGYGDNYEKRDLYASEKANEMVMNNADYRNPEVDSYKKMYEEHMRKMQMDQQALNQQNYSSSSGVNRNANEQREFLSKQNNYNEPNMNELESNFNALNIDNQEVLYRKPTYHNAPSQENNVTGQQKLDKQKVYRDYLNMQVLEKGKNNTISTEPISRLNKLKNNNIQENPFSNRNRDLGSSSLNSNPISGGNNYSINYPSSNNSRGSNPYLIGGDGRDTPSTREKLRMLGNNIMK